MSHELYLNWVNIHKTGWFSSIALSDAVFSKKLTLHAELLILRFLVLKLLWDSFLSDKQEFQTWFGRISCILWKMDGVQ